MNTQILGLDRFAQVDVSNFWKNLFCVIVSRLPIPAEVFHSSNSMAGRDYITCLFARNSPAGFGSTFLADSVLLEYSLSIDRGRLKSIRSLMFLFFFKIGAYTYFEHTQKFTFDCISRHFKSIRNFWFIWKSCCLQFLKFLFNMAASPIINRGGGG